MLLCIIFSALTYFLTVTCQTDPECRLEVINKTAFENKIVDYIKEDATFMIIEYNLTITSNGNLSDWYNISDPFSIEPWRWYRVKGANMTRLLLMYNKILFGHLLFFDTYKTIPVNLADHPSGCIANVSTTDMYSFIMRAVVEDFYVRFENLRTSEKLYRNPYVCTSRRDETTGSKYRWCCRHNFNDDIVCEPVQEYSIAMIAIYIFAAVVVWLLFLFSPYLLQTDKKVIYESVSLEGFFPNQPSTSAAYPIADSSKADSSKSDSQMTGSPKFQIKLNSYYEKDKPLPFGLFDLLRSQKNCGRDDSNANKDFPCSKVLGRLSIVLFFFILPTILLYIRYVSLNEFVKISVAFFLSIFFLMCIVIYCVICVDKKKKTCTNSFIELSETNLSLYLQIPMVTIISSTCRVPYNKESKEKTPQCIVMNIIFLFLSLIATIPACALTFVIVTAVVLTMYKVTFIYTMLSGLATFLVYVREKVNEVRKQHERCLKIITEKIEDYIKASNVTTTEKNLHFYKDEKSLDTWIWKDGTVTVKGCIPFLFKGGKIYIKDSVLFHYLCYEQKKLFYYIILAGGFIGIIVLLVIFINSMEFISPSIQVLITVFTSIIPLLLKIAFTKGHNDCTLFFDTEEFKKKMDSYEEKFKNETGEETQTKSNLQQQTKQDNREDTGEVAQSQNSNADERAKSSLASGGDIEQGPNDERKISNADERAKLSLASGGDIEQGPNDERKKRKRK